jgi:ribA/ribD-fused uncharacterized protein
MTIKSFEGKFRCFSNFYLRQAPYKGSVYKSKEHAYQCQKATNEKDFLSIFNAPSPYKAKRKAKKIKTRPDWKNVNIKIMHEIVLEFFQYYQDCREILLSTGNEELQEGNTWGDRFFGMVDGEGENWLGKILMDVRIILQGFPSVMIKDDINTL